MTKRLSAITGEYQDQQGNSKAEWTNVGVIVTGKNGKDYALLDPTVNLAGILAKQNVLAMKKGEQLSDMVMTSVFEDNNQSQQQGGFNQASQQGGYNQNQGGFQQQPAPHAYQQNQGGYNQNNG